MGRFRRHNNWMRWLGFAAVPLVIAASFLALLIGIAGLCIGADGMADPDSMTTLCVFFCGVIVSTAPPLLALWILLAATREPKYSFPLPHPAPIFHPPTALAA